MGHSGLSEGSLKSSSSNNSAARLLQAFLCRDQCDAWQPRQQYLTILHAVHVLSLISSASALLQLAQTSSVVSSVVEDMVGGKLLVVLLLGNMDRLDEIEIPFTIQIR